MRNLKKVLALVLALVMAMSLVTIANAADFSDDADINYKEAVDVMSAVGVLNGLDTGAFNPQGTLTREQAAKIICTMMLGDSAEKLGTTSSSFTDVAATRWSSPYIEYCASIGIIAGNGDGTFNPTGKLTGHAFAKMLLGALGYSSEYEGYTGAGWSIEVAKDAVTAGIDVDGVSLSSELTREQAAQMALQAMEATLVEYKTAGTTIVTPDGFQVITAGSTASKVENSDTKAGYDGEKDGFQQFCEEYFSDLKKNTSAEDDYIRPAVAWTYDKDTIGTYAKEADATYTVATEVGDIYSDLGLDATVKASDIDLFVDGVASDGTGYVEGGAIADITRRGTTEYGVQGAQMDVYYDDDAEVVTICIVNTYLGIVTDDDYTSDGDDGILVEVYGDATGTYFVKNATYEQDTVLLVQVADDEIQAVIGEPETVTGSITRISNEDEVTLDGTKYAKATQFTDATDDDVIDGVAASALETDEDITYILYLDQYGNYIAAAVAEDNAQEDIVYVHSVDVYQTTVDRKNVYAVFANVVRMDGTVEEVVLGDDVTFTTDTAAEADALYTNAADLEGEFATLSYDDSDDAYTLSASTGDYTSIDVVADVKLEDDDTRAQLVSGSTTNYYLSNDTVYVFITLEDGDIDDVTVVTGGVNYTTTAGKALHESRNVGYVVFTEAYETSSDNIIYFNGADYRGTESTGFIYRGYALGDNDYTDFVVYSVDDNKLVRSGASAGEANVGDTTLAGFYEYSEKTDGSLKLTQITESGTPAEGSKVDGYTAYDDNADSYIKADLDEIRSGLVEFTAQSGKVTAAEDETALVSNAVVVDLTDADDASENTYGRKVSSVSTIKNLLDASTPYTVEASMYINSDNEVEAIFITKIAGGPDVAGGGAEDTTTYELGEAPTVTLTTGKVNFADTVINTSEGTPPTADVENLTVTVTVEERVSGEWKTLETKDVSAKITQGTGALDVTSVDVGVVAGTSYRVTITLSGDNFGTMTLYSGTTSFSA